MNVMFRTLLFILLLIVAVTISGKNNECFGDNPSKAEPQMEGDEALLRGSAPLFRLGMTFPKMVTMMDAEANYYYNMGIGFFLDWMFWRERNPWGNGFDLYTRFTYRYFWTSEDILNRQDDYVYKDNMIHILSLDAGIRLVFGTYMFGQSWQIYVAAAPRFLYLLAEGKNSRYGEGHPDSSTNLGSIGIIGAMGFEVTILEWLGLFGEINAGYCPVGEGRNNVEGLTFYIGLTYRSSFLDSDEQETVE